MIHRFAHCPAVLRELGLLPVTELAMFVVGSMARGWDHGSSDLDLVIVSSDRFRHERLWSLTVPLVPDSIDVAVFYREGQRWEVKFWLDAQVDQLMDKVSHDAFSNDRKVGNRLVEPEELFLERLVTCIPLSGMDWVRRRQKELEESAFRALVLTHMLSKSDTKAEAAISQLLAGDVESAVLSAKEAFGCAIDALLIGNGEYSGLIKWRARRFRDAAPRLLTFEEYWSLETMQTYDPAAPEKWVEQVVSLCKNVSMDIEI